MTMSRSAKVHDSHGVSRRVFLGALGAAAMASAVVVHMSGSVSRIARVALLCAGLCLGHAAFRARTVAARWSFFKDQAEKVD